MKFRLVCVAALAAALLAVMAARTAQPAAAASPTFTKDVAPILYKHCASCHRPGDIAPMSLLTYEDARPWAKSIREQVATGQMPPWHAEAAHGVFSNDRRLSEQEKGDAARVGQRWRAQRRGERSAACAEIHRRLGNRHARRGRQYAEGIRSSGVRHD